VLLYATARAVWALASSASDSVFDSMATVQELMVSSVLFVKELSDGRQSLYSGGAANADWQRQQRIAENNMDLSIG
jgi:hypothetical protein